MISLIRIGPAPALGAILAVLFSAGCDNSAEEGASAPPDLRALQLVPFEGAASEVLVDDVDANGMLDLVFTTHGGNHTQVFYQRQPRVFEAGPKVTTVGFHPGNLTRVPTVENPLYVMSAEGESRLLTLTPDPEQSFAVVSEAAIPFPRFALPFQWPGWGLGIAAASFSPPSVLLLKGFDPLDATADRLTRLRTRGTNFALCSPFARFGRLGWGRRR
jgi:hypothetical protein